MALSVGLFGDNPQQPLVVAESYIPDQLIAGNKHLVTEPVTVSGAAALPRGSVMGIAAAGALTSATGKVQASGTVVVNVVPTDGDTVTIQGTAITFNVQTQVNQLAGPLQVLFTSAMTTAQIAQAFLAVLNASTDANLIKMKYSLSGSTITVTAVFGGTGGNAFTLATSNGTSFTVSGGTLSGGTANAGTATIGSITAGPRVRNGVYTIILTSATQGFVVNPIGETLGQMTMGTAFTDPEINFTITTGGAPAAGDGFFINVADATAANVWKLCTAGAVDGSAVPQGILVDFTDPSSGNVLSGVYTEGEFNGNAIVYDSSLTPQFIKNAFRGRGIIIKSVVSASDPS